MIHTHTHTNTHICYWEFFLWFVFNKLFQKDEVYLNLVLDYVPETVYRVARHYSRAKQTLPVIYVKVCKNGAVSHFRGIYYEQRRVLGVF